MVAVLLFVSMMAGAGTHLATDDTIRDLLAHPAFAGFGRLLLPWDSRAYDAAMPLRNIGSLLPYHSHVDPPTVVSALNHVIDAVVMAYTGHSDYSAHEPSTFVVVGEQDRIALPSVMEKRVAALRKAGADVEFHRFGGLGHGFGPGVGTAAEGWLDRAVRFWERSPGATRLRH